jgi:anti-sigma B factor antagonist
MPEHPVTAVQPHDEVVWVQVKVAALHDEQTVAMQTDVLAAAEKRPGLPVALDMSEVNFFPSMSLGALVTVHQQLKKQGRKFVLLSVQPQVRDTMAVTRLDRLFEMHDSLDHVLIQIRRG